MATLEKELFVVEAESKRVDAADTATVAIERKAEDAAVAVTMEDEATAIEEGSVTVADMTAS